MFDILTYFAKGGNRHFERSARSGKSTEFLTFCLLHMAKVLIKLDQASLCLIKLLFLNENKFLIIINVIAI